MRRWQSWLLSLFAIALVFGKVPSAWAFPGLYVGGANAELYNHTAQVAIAREQCLCSTDPSMTRRRHPQRIKMGRQIPGFWRRIGH